MLRRFLGLLVCVAIPIASAGPYTVQASEVGTDTASATCKNIDATIGLLVAATSGSSGPDTTTLTATVGVKWDDSSAPICSQKPGPVDHTNTFEIVYTQGTGGGGNIPNTIRFKSSGTAGVDGQAIQLDPDDPQWWFDFAASISETAPSISSWNEGLNRGAGGWEPVGWTPLPDHTNKVANPTGTDQSQNNNQNSNTPTLGGQKDGDTRGEFTGNAARSKVKIQYKTTSNAISASGDNTDVQNERLEYKFTLSATVVN